MFQQRYPAAAATLGIMGENDSGCFVTCATVVEWTNAQGTTTRKVSYKTATSRLIRNNLRQLLVEIRVEKSNSAIKLHCQEISVFNRFMGEGKASIKFKLENCTLYLSNAPAAQLINFLKTIFIKMTGKEDEKPMKNPLKEKLANRTGGIEDISPATIAEISKAKEKAFANASRATITTPSPTNIRKRKLTGETTSGSSNTPKIPRAKKLFNNPTIGKRNSDHDYTNISI